MHEPSTLIEAVTYFSDADRAHDFVVRMRWPAGVSCPRCGSDQVGFVQTRRIWNCKGCKKQFSTKVGTIFEDSPIGLDKWLPAMWLICNAKNGISSYELGRSLGITQKSAWFMLHRIRLALQNADRPMLDGEIEVDETFIGGKARFMHKGKRERLKSPTGMVGKVAVQGLLDRHGPDGHSTVRAHVVEGTSKKVLAPKVRANVQPGATVYTDALGSYNDLERDYVRGVIDHAEKYAEGNVHTNGIENFWSLLKRAVKGTYVSIEPFHLFRYLDEEMFRFNTRGTNDGSRFVRAAGRVVGKRLTYADLTGKTTV